MAGRAASRGSHARGCDRGGGGASEAALQLAPGRAVLRPGVPDLAKILAGFAIGREVSSEALAALAADARMVRAVEGEVLWAEGARADRVLLIQAGLVQIVRHAATGDDQSIALFGPRELVGLTAVLESAPYPADAMVVSETAALIALPAAALERIAAADLGVARAMTTALLAHTHALRAKIAMVTGGDTAQRLARLFAHLAERFGDEDAAGATRIPLALTRRMLGQLIGARTETVIRVLSKWQQAGLVTTGPDGFAIRSLAALTDLG